MKSSFFDIWGNCKDSNNKPSRMKVGNSRPVFEFIFNDNFTFHRRVSPHLRTAPNCSDIQFNMDFSAIAKAMHRPLSALESDFLWLAAAVYFADRCSLRYPYGKTGPSHWRRRIHIVLPMVEARHWSAIEASIAYVLEFLTEDDWTFEFKTGRAAFEQELQQHFPTLPPPEVNWTSLFSGGLDSLAGALHQFSTINGVGQLVSGQTHHRMAAGQREQADQVRNRFEHRVEHLNVRYGFSDKQCSGLIGLDSSQRTRAFVHTALGALSALRSGNFELFLFENGIGAFNLPCDSTQIGSMNSRGTHPLFLYRMGRLISEIFCCGFTITNPFWLSTKAQMLVSEGVYQHSHLLNQSFSCDKFPNYKHKQSQCGCCPSCLIRRLSFHQAQLSDDSSNYSTNIFKLEERLSEAGVQALAKINTQVESLEECLKESDPWLALCATWPDLLRTELELGVDAKRDSLITLFRQHVSEWRALSHSIDSNIFALAA